MIRPSSLHQTLEKFQASRFKNVFISLSKRVVLLMKRRSICFKSHNEIKLEVQWLKNITKRSSLRHFNWAYPKQFNAETSLARLSNQSFSLFIFCLHKYHKRNSQIMMSRLYAGCVASFLILITTRRDSMYKRCVRF